VPCYAVVREIPLRKDCHDLKFGVEKMSLWQQRLLGFDPVNVPGVVGKEKTSDLQ